MIFRLVGRRPCMAKFGRVHFYFRCHVVSPKQSVVRNTFLVALKNHDATIHHRCGLRRLDNIYHNILEWEHYEFYRVILCDGSHILITCLTLTNNLDSASTHHITIFYVLYLYVEISWPRIESLIIYLIILCSKVKLFQCHLLLSSWGFCW